MKNTTTNLRTIGWIAFFAFAIVFVVVLVSGSMTTRQSINALIFAGIICVFGVIMFVKARNAKDNIDLNSLSFEDRCRYMADQLRWKKRSWFLTPSGDDRFLAVPLSPRNMNEMGGGPHFPVDESHVEDLLSEGLIVNYELVKTVLTMRLPIHYVPDFRE